MLDEGRHKIETRGALLHLTRQRCATPILFIIFNRPEKTAQSFERIRQARPSRLYVAGDGPRPNLVGEENKVKHAREIASNVDWECEVRFLFSDENKGCRRAVATALNWFFENEEMGIIIEDDVVAHPMFFQYCEDALITYKGDTSVGIIGGFSISDHSEEARPMSVRFVSNTLVWGWATWRRVWREYDEHLTEWTAEDNAFLLRQGATSPTFVDMWCRIFNSVTRNEVDTWDYQLMYLLFKKQLLCAIPPVNLITNIGYDSEATHTHSKRPAWLRDSFDGEMQKIVMTTPRINQQAETEILRKVYGITRVADIKTIVKRALRAMKRLSNWHCRKNL